LEPGVGWILLLPLSELPLYYANENYTQSLVSRGRALVSSHQFPPGPNLTDFEFVLPGLYLDLFSRMGIPELVSNSNSLLPNTRLKNGFIRPNIFIHVGKIFSNYPKSFNTFQLNTKAEIVSFGLILHIFKNKHKHKECHSKVIPEMTA
jgi:hypothetical protein